MYTVEELIDHIRELEAEKNLDTVYAIIISDSNNYGDPFSWVHGVWQDPNNIPEFNSILDDVVRVNYDEYKDGGGSCCGWDSECCGSLSTFEEWKSNYIKMSPAGSHTVDRFNKYKEEPTESLYLFIGIIDNEYDESHMEVTLQALKVKDA